MTRICHSSPTAQPVAEDANFATSGQNSTANGFGKGGLIIWDAFGSKFGGVQISDLGLELAPPKCLSMCGRWGRPTKPIFWPIPGPHHSPKGHAMDANAFSTTIMAPLSQIGGPRNPPLGPMGRQSQARWTMWPNWEPFRASTGHFEY